MKMGRGLGVIIGRFQVDEIHEGHLQLLKYVSGKHPRMLVLLGCRHSPATRTNPLEFQLRQAMVQEHVPNALILPVFDQPDDGAWSRQVDGLIGGVFPGEPTVIYGGRESFIPHYSGHHPTKELNFPDNDGTSGTSIREGIAMIPRATPDFRAGVIYALEHLQPRIFTTVDVAMFKGPELLLGRKAGETGWRLPGGFVDLKDPDLETAAIRELHEETGMTAEHGVRYIRSFTVDDWRTRGAVDAKHLTALFTTEYFSGAPRGNDDLPEVQWFNTGDLDLLKKIVPTHRPLVTHLLSRCEGLLDVVSSRE